MLDCEWNEDIVYHGKTLIRAKQFSEKYGMSINSIHVANNHNHPYIYTIKGAVYIDEQALLRRREFWDKVWRQAHENLFEITEFISEYKLAYILSKFTDRSQSMWAMYFSRYLFSTNHMDKSLLSYKLSTTLWEFWRLTTFMIRRLKRLEARRQEEIYKRLPNRDNYSYTKEQEEWFYESFR